MNRASLETKIPPPLVALLFAGAMLALARFVPAGFAWRGDGRVASGIALLGVVTAASGMLAFRRARTTINPVDPGKASSIVTTGVYGITRNPMYLGLTLVLTAWAFQLGSALTIVGPILFVAYITRFQIIPEERILITIFGDAYAEYTRRVRRWI